MGCVSASGADGRRWVILTYTQRSLIQKLVYLVDRSQRFQDDVKRKD